MNRILVIVCLYLVALNGHAGQSTAGEEQLRVAKAAVKTLAGALQVELKTAMQSGGPVAAIQVCNGKAMSLTQQIASDQNIHLARVSLKNRNPANVAKDWQAVVLKDFESQRASGEDVNTLSWSDIADVDGMKEHRFMKAIPTAGVCLACHGTELSGEIAQVLGDLYPWDLATGYKVGEIRGAFVVTQKFSE